MSFKRIMHTTACTLGLALWGLSGCDSVTLPEINQDPIASSGADRSAQVGGRVTLSALGSVDADDDQLSYSWEQTEGPAAVLNNPSSSSPSFVASVEGLYVFALTVSDGRGGSDVSSVRISVGADETMGRPFPDAGENQVVNEGGAVTLRATNSSDPDGDVLHYSWSQIAGPTVNLSNPFVAEPRFTAPDAAETIRLVFEVLVSDSSGLSASDNVTITVRDIDPIPECFTDADCSDGEYCNGVESCLGGTCYSGSAPCLASASCSEQTGTCTVPLPPPPPPPTLGTATITSSGGTVNYPGVATVTFPSGAFAQDQTVRITTTSDPATDALFQDTTSIFAASDRLSYEVRIFVSGAQPATDVSVTIEVPDSFRGSVPPGSEIRVFALNLWSDGNEALDEFQLLTPRFDPTVSSANVSLSPWIFTDGRGANGQFEAVLLLATTPTVPTTGMASVAISHSLGAPRQGITFQATPGECQGSSLVPPLNPLPTPTSPFGPRNLNGKKYHYGTDYGVPVGTLVMAMASGSIERIALQGAPATNVGAGYYMVIRHLDGSATQYMHLQVGSELFELGSAVRAGAAIALSGNSGSSTGPHLHVSYAPNGSIYNNDERRDPHACINANVMGSITVRDNGNAADDAFTVSLNGLVICQTAIGASNTCAANNLLPGTADLVITATIAPVDVGTYEILLADGLTFTTGGATTSGAIPQGSSASFTINIPN